MRAPLLILALAMATAIPASCTLPRDGIARGEPDRPDAGMLGPADGIIDDGAAEPPPKDPGPGGRKKGRSKRSLRLNLLASLGEHAALPPALLPCDGEAGEGDCDGER